jgi:hypothetical protein
MFRIQTLNVTLLSEYQQSPRSSELGPYLPVRPQLQHAVRQLSPHARTPRPVQGCAAGVLATEGRVLLHHQHHHQQQQQRSPREPTVTVHSRTYIPAWVQRDVAWPHVVCVTSWSRSALTCSSFCGRGRAQRVKVKPLRVVQKQIHESGAGRTPECLPDMWSVNPKH